MAVINSIGSAFKPWPWEGWLRKTLIIALCLALAGCGGAYDIKSLREIDTPSAGTPFTQALTREYRSLTLYKADYRNDWPNAYLFAAKGMAASRGEEVLPEDPDDWRLSQSHRAEFHQDRVKLIAALATGRTEQPKTAAKAQAAFDCWIEQQEQGWQLADIATCHGEFATALAELGTRVP
jgi:OOP family OmpA-OmpF porin